MVIKMNKITKSRKVKLKSGVIKKTLRFVPILVKRYLSKLRLECRLGTHNNLCLISTLYSVTKQSENASFFVVDSR